MYSLTAIIFACIISFVIGGVICTIAVMAFAGGHGQKIVYHYIDKKKNLHIITHDKAIGKYVLWQDNKKIAMNKNVMELYERIGE